jgi:predicted transcriptional regulator
MVCHNGDADQMVISHPAEPEVYAAMLEENRRRLVADLRPILAAYETRYEIPSDRIAEELEAGRLRDTEDVCDWVIAWETYRALAADGPPRLE